MREEILKILTIDNTIDKLIYEEEVSSTNTVVKNLALSGHTGSALAICEIQTAGRGRRGRSWSSPYGSGIWMSILVKPDMSAESIPMLTILSAISIARTLKEAVGMGISIGIKWPNDVIIEKKKVCGILCEMVNTPDSTYAICGIGINVNTPSFPDDLSDKATSLFIETGHEYERELIAVSVVQNFMELYNEFTTKKDLSFIVDEYNELLVSRNKEVILTSANNEYENNPYTALCIDETGALIVTDKNGKLVKITSGEVSVRGILGYV